MSQENRNIPNQQLIRFKSTKEKYHKKESKKEEDHDPLNIKFTTKGTPRIYVQRAISLLVNQKNEYVILSGIGKTISTICIVAEVLKRRVQGLHQITTLTNTEIQEIYEPLEEGLDEVVDVKRFCLVKIVLTKNPTEEQKMQYGYQPPLNPEEVIPQYQHQRQFQSRQGRGYQRNIRRGRRGGYQYHQSRNQQNGFQQRGNRQFRGIRARGGRFQRNIPQKTQYQNYEQRGQYNNQQPYRKRRQYQFEDSQQNEFQRTEYNEYSKRGGFMQSRGNRRFGRARGQNKY